MSCMSLALSDAESIADTLSESDFDEYQKLGEGYYSSVYLVVKNGFKMVKKESKPGRDPTHLQNEVELLSNLKHDNVISLYADFPGQDYAIFEFCSGGDLGAQIDYLGRISLDVAMQYAYEITSGLAYLHKESILHRDIKADNVLLSRGHAKISDFGSSVLLTAGQQLTELEGSPINCSPEMIKSTGYSYPRDCWSLGILIYHMIVGEFPFDGDDQMSIFVKILMDSPQFPKHVDEITKDLILGLLCKDPQKRSGLGWVKYHKWFKSRGEDEIAFEDFEIDITPKFKIGLD